MSLCPATIVSMSAIPTSVHRWESEHRYYLAWIQRNLFGELELATVWGGKRNRLGRVRYTPVASLADATAALTELDRRRRARRYRRVGVGLNGRDPCCRSCVPQ